MSLVFTPRRVISGPKKILDPSLVAWYRFQEGSGNTIHDSSLQENTGTNNGATWTDDTGRGTKLVFDGINDQFTVPDSTSLRNAGGSTRTINFWTLLTKAAPGVAKNFLVFGTGDNVMLLRNVGDDNWWARGSTATDFRNMGAGYDNDDLLDAWHMLTLVADSEQLIAYLDGSLTEDWGLTGVWSDEAVSIKLPYNPGDFAFILDDFRVYNRALSAGEIALIYNRTK